MCHLWQCVGIVGVAIVCVETKVKVVMPLEVGLLVAAAAAGCLAVLGFGDRFVFAASTCFNLPVRFARFTVAAQAGLVPHRLATRTGEIVALPGTHAGCRVSRAQEFLTCS